MARLRPTQARRLRRPPGCSLPESTVNYSPWLAPFTAASDRPGSRGGCPMRGYRSGARLALLVVAGASAVGLASAHASVSSQQSAAGQPIRGDTPPAVAAGSALPLTRHDPNATLRVNVGLAVRNSAALDSYGQNPGQREVRPVPDEGAVPGPLRADRRERPAGQFLAPQSGHRRPRGFGEQPRRTCPGLGCPVSARVRRHDRRLHGQRPCLLLERPRSDGAERAERELGQRPVQLQRLQAVEIGDQVCS